MEEAEQEEIERWLGYAELLIDQIDRRVLQGETIPQQEKVFSLFEPHARWCVKGKAGVPVSVVGCAQQSVLHWQVMWEEQDVDMAAELVERTQRRDGRTRRWNRRSTISSSGAWGGCWRGGRRASSGWWRCRWWR